MIGPGAGEPPSHLAAQLVQADACEPAREWASRWTSARYAWAVCPAVEWLAWIAARVAPYETIAVMASLLSARVEALGMRAISPIDQPYVATAQAMLAGVGGWARRWASAPSLAQRRASPQGLPHAAPFWARRSEIKPGEGPRDDLPAHDGRPGTIHGPHRAVRELDKMIASAVHNVALGASVFATENGRSERVRRLTLAGHCSWAAEYDQHATGKNVGLLEEYRAALTPCVDAAIVAVDEGVSWER